MSLATIERLRSFAETARKAVVDERDAENAFQGVQHAHLAGGAGLGGNLDLIGGGDGGVGLGLFSVRLGSVSGDSLDETKERGEGNEERERGTIL